MSSAELLIFFLFFVNKLEEESRRSAGRTPEGKVILYLTNEMPIQKYQATGPQFEIHIVNANQSKVLPGITLKKPREGVHL